MGCSVGAAGLEVERSQQHARLARLVRSQGEAEALEARGGHAAEESGVTRVKGPHPRVLFALHRSPGLACGTETVPPGSEVPWHEHSEASEMLLCLAGRGEVQLRCDGAELHRPFEGGVMVCVPPQVQHRIVNVGAGELRLAWAISPPQEVVQFKARL
jgi:quercetin dioxygenase-like cupin family protein